MVADNFVRAVPGAHKHAGVKHAGELLPEHAIVAE
jgi:hypothetical protein